MVRASTVVMGAPDRPITMNAEQHHGDPRAFARIRYYRPGIRATIACRIIVISSGHNRATQGT